MLQDKGDYWQQWQKLLEAAAEIQGILPGAVLMGESAASIHLGHQFSFDADHILLDIEENYEKVLDFLEGRDDWETARIRPPKLILGNFRGVETGIRQLMRRRPLETIEIQTGTGKPITVPTVTEMLRTKAWMIVSRNATRDFMDFASLAGHLGIEPAVTVLEDLDAYYLDLLTSSPACRPRIPGTAYAAAPRGFCFIEATNAVSPQADTACPAAKILIAPTRSACCA